MLLKRLRGIPYPTEKCEKQYLVVQLGLVITAGVLIRLLQLHPLLWWIFGSALSFVLAEFELFHSSRLMYMRLAWERYTIFGGDARGDQYEWESLSDTQLTELSLHVKRKNMLFSLGALISLIASIGLWKASGEPLALILFPHN